LSNATKSLPGRSVAECFMAYYRAQVQREITAARSYTLWRAANSVLGRNAHQWLDTPEILWSNRRRYIGTLDDERLQAVLRELDELRSGETFE
jgi:hypothetical protein